MTSVIRTERVNPGMVRVIIPDYIPPDDPVLLRARELMRERCSPEAQAAFERQVVKWTTHESRT
jgi:hypothetical protein